MTDADNTAKQADPQVEAASHLRWLLDNDYLVKTGQDDQGVYFQAPPQPTLSNGHAMNTRIAEAFAWSKKEDFTEALRDMGPDRRCYLLRLVRALHNDDWDQVTNEEFVPRTELGVSF